MKQKLLLLALISLALTGCSDNKKLVDLRLHYITTDSAPVAATDKNSQVRLASAANSVSHSLQQLDSMNQAVHPHAQLAKPLNSRAIGMGQVSSIDWTGPVEPLVKKIASATHYKLRVLGSRPTIPVLVSINVQNEMLGTILRNATLQVEKKAAIKVYPKQHVIELQYYPN